MGAGAYAFDISPSAEQLGANVKVKRIVPLPPVQNTGIIKYGRVFLSLCATVDVDVTINILTSGGVSVPLGFISVKTNRRSGIGREIAPGDEAAEISFDTSTNAAIKTTVTAFVEFSTP
jgi:hypothetical protein